MKKKKFLAPLGGALILAVLFAVCGCGGNTTAQLYDLTYDPPVVTAQKLYGVTGYELQSLDSAGTALFRKTDSSDGTVRYVLYDITTGNSEDTLLLPQSVAPGLYYTCSDYAEGYSYRYTVYESGKCVEHSTCYEPPQVFNGALYAGGMYYYKKPWGELETARELPRWPVGGTMYNCGKYRVQYADDYIYVYESDTFVKAVSYLDICGDWAAATSMFWLVDGKIFVQYEYDVPEDSSDFTYYSGSQKMRLVTRSYDIGSGKTEDYEDFGFVLSRPYFFKEKYAAYLGRPITEDKRLGGRGDVLQTFGANGKVYVDLQKLLPGATELYFEEGYMFLSDTVITRIYANDRLAGTLYADSPYAYVGGGIVSDGITLSTPGGETVGTMPEDETLMAVSSGGARFISRQAGLNEYRMKIVDGEAEREYTGNIVSRQGDYCVVTNSAGSYDLIDMRNDVFIFQNEQPVTGSISVRSLSDRTNGNIVHSYSGNIEYKLLTASVGGVAEYWAIREQTPFN